MPLIDTLDAQIRCMGLPLFAVTLSAVPRPDTPLLLMLHWHGFRRKGPAHGLAAEPMSVPASALQINERWLDFNTIEQDLLDAAWQLGAWNLERSVQRACNTIGAPLSESLACRQAFGDIPATPFNDGLVEEAPDRASLLALASRVGYVRWSFRPIAGGLWQAIEGDVTLEAGGRRTPPCPISPLPPEHRRRSTARNLQTVYRLGRMNGLIRQDATHSRSGLR